MRPFKDLIRTLLHVSDTPERTALAYAIGVFLGFSPFLGLHTAGGVAIAFLFRLNRIAVLLGVWSNTPWWLLPYYSVATWVGFGMTGYHIDATTFRTIYEVGLSQGFLTSAFWHPLAAQRGLLLSFTLGSVVLAALLGLIAYALSLRWIRFYRSKRGGEPGSPS